jgi:hypothetical protein
MQHCLFCNEPFEPRQKLCGKCKRACSVCGIPFVVRRIQQKTCSTECAHSHKPVPKCKHCGKPVRQPRNRHCSRRCYRDRLESIRIQRWKDTHQ